LLGDDVVLVRRGDGKPEFADDSHHISVTHGADLTGVVTAKSTVACDLESVQTRSERQWEDLLGVGYHGIESALASLAKDSPANAATRIWTARECLKKAGAPFDAPLSLEARESDGWVVFKAGDRKIASRIVSFEHGERPLALAILAGVDHESV
jgi:enediyne polyketide synthase